MHLDGPIDGGILDGAIFGQDRDDGFGPRTCEPTLFHRVVIVARSL